MKTSEPQFSKLARTPDLDQETAFTICSMIRSVGWELVEDWDWDWLTKREEDYRSLIDPALLDGAWALLLKKDWYSLQTTNDVEKKISTITPLEGLIRLRTLILQNNQVEDLQPLSKMVKLRELSCYSNRISDLTPLRNLHALEVLSLGKNPIASLQVLEELPNLQELSMSTDKFSKLAECGALPSLRKLEIDGDGVIESLARLPQMPSLRILSADGVRDLTGIERFTELQNVSLSEGNFADIDPMRSLKSLTHLRLSTTGPVDLAPLAGLHALRAVSIDCSKVSGRAVLTRLPVLREIRLNDEIIEADEGVPPWSEEFTADTISIQPSLDVQVVDQEAFDFYDSKASYGIAKGETDEDMLSEERNWLVQELSSALAVQFDEEIDFALPFMAGMRRSERLVIYSVGAYESFRDIATIVQRTLCAARNNWIIYCQSLLEEGPDEQEIPDGMEDFIVWIYPNKIVAVEDEAAIVRKLIEWRQ